MIRKVQNTVAEPVCASKPIVVVVDDDLSVRESLGSLLRSVDLDARLFGSPAELVQGTIPDRPGCIVLDVRLPGVSGLDLQGQLAGLGIALPTIFMTGHGDIPMCVRAMKAGAVDFLAKPFRDQDMIDAVLTAIDRDMKRRARETAMEAIGAEYESLTSREREVLAHVATGLMNKQVAGLMGLSEITVKIHRASLMRKMNARSLADLVRKAGTLGVPRTPAGRRPA